MGSLCFFVFACDWRIGYALVVPAAKPRIIFLNRFFNRSNLVGSFLSFVTVRIGLGVAAAYGLYYVMNWVPLPVPAPLNGGRPNAARRLGVPASELKTEPTAFEVQSEAWLR
jgi:hypothetical protein